MQQTHCDTCRKLSPSYDVVNYGSVENGYRKLCSQCFNEHVSRLDGLDHFEHAQFEPTTMIDAAGRAHEFHFRTRLFGPGVALDAFELRNGEPTGYRLQVIGAPEHDLFALFARLIEKIRRVLSIQHVKDDAHGLHIADQTVRGLIEWDEDRHGRVPLLIIDGRTITWEELGHMLMSFEGWQFKLEIRDRSEDL